MGSVTVSELVSFLERERDSPGEPEIDPCLGIIFFPTDEEVIRILVHKISNPDFDHPVIFETNIYEYEPDQIPELPAIQPDGIWWSFFCAPKRLKATRECFSRATRTGYWKATGDPSPIKAKGTHDQIGSKRTLVFYKRFPGGTEEKTNWVMHEYSANSNPQKDFVVCRIKQDRNKKRPSSTQKEDRKKKRPKSTKIEGKGAKKPHTFTNNADPPSHSVALDNRDHVAEKSSPEPQPPISCYLISDPSFAVENTYPASHYPWVTNFNNHAIEDTPQVDSLPLGNQTSLCTESPMLLEQGPSSFFVSSDDNELLNSSLGSASHWEDYSSLLLVPRDELPGEGTGYTGGLCEGFWSNIPESV